MTGFIRKTVGSLTGSTKAGKAADRAANIAASAEREKLEYLKEREALPQKYREASLTQLGGLYGLDQDFDQAAAIEALRGSPIYGAIIGGREAGEEAIMRQAAATGGLRSGNVQEALYDYNTQLENEALLHSMQGLQGMAQLPTMAPEIAQSMSNIGEIRAQGKVARGRAQQEGMGMWMSAISNAAGAFSDERLKDKIRKVGEQSGYSIYTWIWNHAAESLGLSGPGIGVLSKEVRAKNPEALGESYGYETVDYKKIGLA